MKLTTVRKLLKPTACSIALCLSAINAYGADVVIEWNNILLETIRSGPLGPPPATRTMAMMNTAIYDAVNSVAQSHQPYHFVPTAVVAADTSKEAAAAQAAFQVLSTMFPANLESYQTSLATSLAAVPDGPRKTAGIELGTSAGMAILALRSEDGARTPAPYIPGTEPGDWQPTPPAFAPAAVPHWANLTPFTMTSNSQFRSAVGPPALDSDEYAAAFNEIKEIGAVDSSTRTAEQSDIAKFWAGPIGTSTPAGQWNRIAQSAAEVQGNTLEENARLFAFVGLAQADAVISSWDNKYHFDFWRPVTAIQAGDTDGNPATEADEDWLPLLTTPNFPSYTAAHGTASGANSKILELFFGTDEVTFTAGTEGFDISDRTFTSFSAAGRQGADSRLYGGIHWGFDNDDALANGQALAIYMHENFLQPVPEPSTTISVFGALIVLSMVRKRRI